MYALERMGPEVVDLLIVPHAAAITSRTENETRVLLIDILRRHWERIVLGHQGTPKELGMLKTKWR